MVWRGTQLGGKCPLCAEEDSESLPLLKCPETWWCRKALQKRLWSYTCLWGSKNREDTVLNGAELRELGNSEPTWLRLAQELLLSLLSLYGDRKTIGYLRVGKIAVRACVWVWGSESHSVFESLSFESCSTLVD